MASVSVPAATLFVEKAIARIAGGIASSKPMYFII
jgi:hypothetical protein